ncbi:hypothetical protein ACWDBD_31230 [Streptomyces sp. NPDC001118]|uniref:hypothetical protein n=1 Tax=Streptomyces sp. CG1 TaxID=1287523 RepID=UPI0034E2DD41
MTAMPPSASGTVTRRCTRAGRPVELPEAPYVHVFVTRGSVELEGTGALAAGDAVRFTASGGHRISVNEPAEISVWEMHVDLAI